MKFRIKLELEKEKINFAIFNAWQLVKKYNCENWSILEPKTAQKRVSTLYKKLSLSSNSQIAEFVHQPLELFCKSIADEFKIHILVLLSQVTQVILK